MESTTALDRSPRTSFSGHLASLKNFFRPKSPTARRCSGSASPAIDETNAGELFVISHTPAVLRSRLRSGGVVRSELAIDLPVELPTTIAPPAAASATTSDVGMVKLCDDEVARFFYSPTSSFSRSSIAITAAAAEPPAVPATDSGFSSDSSVEDVAAARDVTTDALPALPPRRRVTFADDAGCKLTRVHTYVRETSGRRSPVGCRFTSRAATSRRQYYEPRVHFVVDFAAPTDNRAALLDRVRRHGVALDSVSCRDAIGLATGRIAVRRTLFDSRALQRVFVRFSFDLWQSHADLNAFPAGRWPADGACDVYAFDVSVPLFVRPRMEPSCNSGKLAVCAVPDADDVQLEVCVEFADGGIVRDDNAGRTYRILLADPDDCM